jgi:hypothetical protein
LILNKLYRRSLSLPRREALALEAECSASFVYIIYLRSRVRPGFRSDVTARVIIDLKALLDGADSFKIKRLRSNGFLI